MPIGKSNLRNTDTRLGYKRPRQLAIKTEFPALLTGGRLNIRPEAVDIDSK